MSNLEPQSAKSACPIPTASSLPRVRYKDIQALSLVSGKCSDIHFKSNSTVEMSGNEHINIKSMISDGILLGK